MSAPFDQLAPWYDAVYAARGKSHRGEAHRLATLIRTACDGAATLLDVACGTGLHLEAFADEGFSVVGLDRHAGMLARARSRLPRTPLFQLDMTDFDLGCTFDAVTCLFSSVGYLADVGALQRSIGCMARHVAPGGLLLVEPAVLPERFVPPERQEITVAIGGRRLRRVTTAERIGDTLSIRFSLHEASADGAAGAGAPDAAADRSTDEVHTIRLFSSADYESAFSSAGLDVSFDADGPGGLGLFVGRLPST